MAVQVSQGTYDIISTSRSLVDNAVQNYTIQRDYVISQLAIAEAQLAELDAVLADLELE